MTDNGNGTASPPRLDVLPRPAVNLARRMRQLTAGRNVSLPFQLVVCEGFWLLVWPDGRVEMLGAEIS